MSNALQWRFFAFESFVFSKSKGRLGLAEIGLMPSCIFPADG